MLMQDFRSSPPNVLHLHSTHSAFRKEGSSERAQASPGGSTDAPARRSACRLCREGARGSRRAPWRRRCRAPSGAGGARSARRARPVPPRLLFVFQQPQTEPVPVGGDGRQLEEHLLVGGGLGLPLRPLPLEVLAVVVGEVVLALGDDAGEPLLETLVPLEGVLGRLRRRDEREW
jgi:hypothetical protein